MAKRSGHSDWKSMRKLRQLAELLGHVPPKEMLSHVSTLLEKSNDEPYTREEVLKILEATDEELVKHSLNQNTEDSKSLTCILGSSRKDSPFLARTFKTRTVITIGCGNKYLACANAPATLVAFHRIFAAHNPF